MLSRVAHRTNLDICRARRDTNHHAERGCKHTACRLHLLDKTAKHELRSLEVCDNTVAQGTNGANIRVSLTIHEARLVTDSHKVARLDAKCNNRGFVNDDLAIVHDECIGRTEVNS